MEQASASKMQKVATSGRAEELVNTHIGTLANAVVKDGMVYGEVLELTLGLVEADFDDVRTATVDYCSSQISSINHDLLIEKTAIKNYYKSAAPTEREFIMSLNMRSEGRNGTTTFLGEKLPAVATDYIITDSDLNLLLIQMQTRVQAVKFEMERRSTLPSLIVLNALVARFKVIESTGLSQEW